MASDFSKRLTNLAMMMGITFTFRGRPISHVEVFSENGILPGLARRADQLCSLCLGYGIGISIEEAEGTLMGLKVTFDEATPDILRYFCILDVICELQKTSGTDDNIVSLDELSYD